MADEIIDDHLTTGPSRNATTTNNQNGNNAAASRPNGASSDPKTTASLDRGPSTSDPTTSGVIQPKPQALAKRTGPASIIVSPRQKGNPVLAAIKSMPWEYGDIPADYVLGTTTCALFLSLKYHRLHPEYIYTRIRNLQGKYNLRIVLTMVDIQNHEDSLKELSKTSLINNVTLILCWSAAEGGRYLELFKTFENAAPTSIKSHQSTAYSDRMIDFITTPRSVNKTDAVSLVSQFGTVRTAVNARHEDVATIAGWGEKKVQRWCAAVREPFRIERAGRRMLSTQGTEASVAEGEVAGPPEANGNGSGASVLLANRSRVASPVQGDADQRPKSRLANEVPLDAGFENDEEALVEALTGPPIPPQKAVETAQEVSKRREPVDEPLDEGVLAALSKLRKT
ncbi:hypothetical protein LTR62_008343 [Meristemomyces frigidus]|uniref:ERCC1-like central domain-containing protein n=1 Tax=Meristemomyces frigidus TaxID=1508187 RepID=A0AAN7YLW4_9PEZI|nr:hypothetical protein LTR62_008343 [Meristemomyces frigidus]